MSEVSNAQSSENIPAELNIDTLKSVYYWLNAKPDTHIKIFPRPKIVSKSDIVDLNTRIQTKLQNHHLHTNITSITVSLEKGEVKSFNAWEVFLNHYWEIPEKIQSVSIVWDITVQLPNYKLPQKHTLKVRIGSSLRPNELFHIMTNGDDETELKENLSFVVCKVDFINVVLSGELISIVEVWYNSLLNTHPKPKFQMFVENNRSSVARIGHYLTTFIGFGFLYIMFKFHLRNFDVVGLNKELYLDAVFWVMALFATYFVFNVIGATFGQAIFEKVSRYEDSHPFAITKGDRNEQIEIDRKNSKVSSNLVWQFVIRLSVAIISMLISTFLLRK